MKTRSGKKHGLTDVGRTKNDRRSKKTTVGTLTSGLGKDDENTEKNSATAEGDCVLPTLPLYRKQDMEEEEEENTETDDEGENQDDENTDGYRTVADDFAAPTDGDHDILHEDDESKSTDTEDEREKEDEEECLEPPLVNNATPLRQVDHHENQMLYARDDGPRFAITDSPNSRGAGRGLTTITDSSKDLWRTSLLDVRNIAIPNAPDTRPMKTMNAFVTKTTVFLAYLIVHAEVNKPFPKISKRFQIDFRVHEIDAMSKEIVDSKFPYTGHWNSSNDPRDHIFSNKSIGTWLANSINKVKYNQTWKIEEGRVVGNKNGLYEPYKNFLENIGVQFS